MTKDLPPVLLDYFCDHTIKRYIAQVVRAFTGYQYASYPGGVETLNIVPCTPDTKDALVATLVQGASETTLPVIPAISVTMTGIDLRVDDTQCLTHTGYVQTVERRAVDGQYTGDEGRAYLVERLMPMPYTLMFDIDVITSNTDQKLQLLEQMLTRIRRDFQIQNSDNALDWGAMTSMSLESVEYSSASGPPGTDYARLDYFTLKMKLPIYLSAPAKVTQRKRIEQIVTNVFDGHGHDGIISGKKLLQEIVTPGNHSIRVNQGSITLLNSKGGPEDAKGRLLDWAELVKVYGRLRPGTSTIRLSTTKDIEAVESDIVGTIAYDPNQINEMIFTLDPSTLPRDTLDPITALINPRTHFPGQGLPNAVIDQRYLINASISGPTFAWGSLSAERNDIIQFDGSQWTVVYRPVSRPSAEPDYVTNAYTGRQLRWSEEGWAMTYDNFYAPGHWRLHV